MALPAEAPAAMAKARQQRDARHDARFRTYGQTTVERLGVAMLLGGACLGVLGSLMGPAYALLMAAGAAASFLLFIRRNQKVTA